mgnify:CR=1 FL=1
MFKAYLTLISKEDKTNKTLISMLEPELISIFEEIRVALGNNYTDEDVNDVIVTSMEKFRKTLRK